MKELIYTKISSQKQYDEYCNIYKELLMKEPDEDNYVDHLELLSLLIKNWDKEQYDGEVYDPISLIKSLMKDHGLKQKDIANICDVSTSYISEILNYKKQLSKNVIRSLADHFKISQSALNKRYELKAPVLYVQQESSFFVSAESHLFIGEYPKRKESKSLQTMIPQQNDDVLMKFEIEGTC